MKRYEYLKLNPLNKEDFKEINNFIEDFSKSNLSPCATLPDCPNPELSCKECAIEYLFDEVKVEYVKRKNIYSKLTTAAKDFKEVIVDECQYCPNCSLDNNKDCLECFGAWLELESAIVKETKVRDE